MLRSVAIQRIKDGLGFRPTLDATIALRLQEAQRELENGKTLPPCLIEEDATLTLLEGTSSVALPDRFIREVDDIDMGIRYTVAGEDVPTYLIRRNYAEAFRANYSESALGPEVYAIRKGTIDFINTADQDYTLTWSYYRAGLPLTSDIENTWLADFNGRGNPAADLLIGEAGWRIAMDLRDDKAVQIFDALRARARAAMFGDIIAREEAAGPYFMGAEN